MDPESLAKAFPFGVERLIILYSAELSVPHDLLYLACERGCFDLARRTVEEFSLAPSPETLPSAGTEKAQEGALSSLKSLARATRVRNLLSKHHLEPRIGWDPFALITEAADPLGRIVRVFHEKNGGRPRSEAILVLGRDAPIPQTLLPREGAYAALIAACRRGPLKLVKWLLEVFALGPAEDQRRLGRAFCGACQCGRLEIVQLLDTRFRGACEPRMFVIFGGFWLACRYDNLSVAQWLAERYEPWSVARDRGEFLLIAKQAESAGHYRVAAWLLSRFGGPADDNPWLI